MTSWKFSYEGSEIEVINGWSGEQLLVNNVLQDEQAGMAPRSRLYGSIKSGDNQSKQIKVSIGGWLTIGCIVFIDNLEVFRSSKR